MASSLCSTSLALDLSSLAFRLGEHYTHLSQMFEEIDIPRSQPISFDQIGAEKILSFAKRLNLLVEDRKELEFFHTEVEKQDKSSWEVYTIFSMQIVNMEEHSRRCRDFGDRIVSALLLRVDCQFEETLCALAAYRKSRHTTHWTYFCCASRDLKRWTTAMKTDRQNFVKVCQWELTKEQESDLKALTASSFDLHDMTINTREISFLQALDSLINSNPSYAEIDIVHHHFLSLTDEAKALLDQALYDLSKDPGKENNPEWAQANRYADIQLFRAAYLHMVRTYWTTHHIYMSDPHKQARFYKQLHACAYGPQYKERKAWVQNELPYLIGLIPSVDQMVRHKLREKALSRGHKNAPNPPPQILSIFRSN